MTMSLTIINKTTNELIMSVSSRELQKNYTTMPLTIIDRITDKLKFYWFILGWGGLKITFWKVSGLIENFNF
jgi:hypothetical protein